MPQMKSVRHEDKAAPRPCQCPETAADSPSPSAILALAMLAPRLTGVNSAHFEYRALGAFEADAMPPRIAAAWLALFHESDAQEGRPLLARRPSYICHADVRSMIVDARGAADSVTSRFSS